MCSHTGALDEWIERAKRELNTWQKFQPPRRVEVDGNDVLQRKIDLIETILEHHRLALRPGATRLQTYSLLASMHTNIWLCAQSALDAEFRHLADCTAALEDIERCMNKLRFAPPVQSL